MALTFSLSRPFARLSNQPIDKSLVYSTFVDLSSYASTNPGAYRGQIVAVSSTNIPYIISDQLSALPIALQNYTDSSFLPLSGGFVTGNIISNSSISANQLNIDNIQLEGNTISITNSDGDLTLSPNGTGEVNIPKIDVDSGAIDNVTIGGTSAAISISSALLNVDNIQVDGNVITSTNSNGNIAITPNGLGEVDISKVDIDSGTIDNVTIGSTTAAISINSALLNVDNIRIDGNAITSTNSDGNIDLTPNGSGEVNITKVDIDSGAIDNTTIGLTTPASAQFTGVHVAGNVSVDGNLFVAGSATTINTVDLVVRDPIIYLAEGNEGDTVDMGFTVAYDYDQEPHKHGGLIRDNTSKKWTLFSGLSTEVLSATNLDLDDASVQIDTLRANIEGTITGNVSGVAAQAVRFVTGRTITTTGDIIYTSSALDGTANVTGVATISSNVVDYSKIQKVSANKILGNPTGSTANVTEIDCTSAARAFLDDATAADQRNTLGVGAAQSVTFADVTVNNANNKSVLSKVYNDSVTGGNTLTLTTFPSANYFSAKYTVQIKDTLSNERCALEIITTNNNGTWEGTVYGIVDPGTVFIDVDIGLANNAVYLEFTFNGVSNYNVIAYTQAFSD